MCGLMSSGMPGPAFEEFDLDELLGARELGSTLGFGAVGDRRFDDELAAVGLEGDRVFDQFREGTLEAGGVGHDGGQVASTILIVSFGAITLHFKDAEFIEMKPTFYYVALALLLFAGLVRKKPLLRWLFGPIFPGLREEGWLKLSRNWALFFIGLAIANEIMRRSLSFDDWLTLKVWGVTIVSLIFAVSNMPMLLRHGLDAESKGEILEETPVE